MTVKAVVFKNGKAAEIGWTYQQGWTWHPTVWMDVPEVECFEVYWDEDGRPTITGRKRRMSIQAASATQRADGVGRREYADDKEDADG